MPIFFFKSPIHENADANIICDFGDGDVTSAVVGVGCYTHGHTHR